MNPQSTLPSVFRPTVHALGWFIGVIATIAAPFAMAQYRLVDDFESYSTGTYNDGSSAFVLGGGPWESNIGSVSGLVSITNDADSNCLAWGWNAGVRGGNRTVTPIAEGSVGTYYFQISTADPTPDMSVGLSDHPTGPLGNYDDFEVQVTLTYDSARGIRLNVRNGATSGNPVTNLAANTWYDVWLVVDNAADTYDVYFGQTGDPQILGKRVANDFKFRNGSATNDLVTFMSMANYHGDNQARLDNIYYNPEIPAPTDLSSGPVSPDDGALRASE